MLLKIQCDHWALTCNKKSSKSSQTFKAHEICKSNLRKSEKGLIQMDSSQKLQVMLRVKTCYELVCSYISHYQKSVSLDPFKWKGKDTLKVLGYHDSIMSSHSWHTVRDTLSPEPTFRDEKLYVWEGDSVDGVCRDVGWKSHFTTNTVLLTVSICIYNLHSQFFNFQIIYFHFYLIVHLYVQFMFTFPHSKSELYWVVSSCVAITPWSSQPTLVRHMDHVSTNDLYSTQISN